MAWVNVTSYYLRYNAEQNQCVVGVHYREGGTPDGQLLVRHLTVPAIEALYLADLLRNEKPVFFEPDSAAIATGKEGVGEGEISQEDGE